MMLWHRCVLVWAYVSMGILCFGSCCYGHLLLWVCVGMYVYGHVMVWTCIGMSMFWYWHVCMGMCWYRHVLA